MHEDLIDAEPLKWAIAQNMVLSICIKAMLTKLDSEVGLAVVRAMNAAPDTDPFLKAVVVDTMERVLPASILAPIHEEMAKRGFTKT